MHPSFALRKLVYSLKPSDTEVRAASAHIGTIRRRLESTLGVKRVIVIGSHARGTAIRQFSDLDVMAILPRTEARWGGDLITPGRFFVKISDQLRSRFVQTKVRVDGQAVVVHFGRSSQAVDVVPAIFHGFQSGRPLYRIPDSAGNWIDTSPARHQRLFEESTDRSGGKLRGLAQLVRAWKHGRDPPIPIASFYTDLLLCKTDIASGVSSYATCLNSFFSYLARSTTSGIRDPEGVAGIVAMAASAASIERVRRSAVYAHEHSKAALDAERASDFDEAVRQWEIVFNRQLR